MPTIEVGSEAPDFTLEGPDGSFTLSEHRGERVVLLFYPGDDTTVCTRQFCAYRDAAEDLAGLGATFVGISTQGAESKEAFKAKHGLTTPLLADPDAEVSKAYGVYSNTFKVAKRSVVVIDPEGKVAYSQINRNPLSFDSVEELGDALAAAG